MKDIDIYHLARQVLGDITRDLNQSRYAELGGELTQGLLSNPVVLQYLQPIVACWDEILPRVKEVRRFGSPLGLMTFTDSFKERIANVITWSNGPEGESTTS